MVKRSTDVAVNPPEAPAENLPSTDVIDYSAYQGMGREEARIEDYSVPFLRILQKGSPEVDENDGKYIAGARPGDILNTVSNAVYPGKIGITAIPCMFHREYVQWVPREAGGGFVSTHQPEDPIIGTAKLGGKNGRELILPNGNNLVDTYYEYCLCETEDGEMFTAVISFTSTQTKKVRKWNSMAGQKRITLPDGRVLSDLPSFAFYYTLRTVVESNDSGSWHGWLIEPVEKPNDAVSPGRFKEAMSFYKQVSSGDVKRAAEHSSDAAYDDSIPGFADNAAQSVL